MYDLGAIIRSGEPIDSEAPGRGSRFLEGCLEELCLEVLTG